MQLLIVSDILESKLGASCLSNFLNINPIIDVPCCQNVDYLSPVEIVSPCVPVVETIVPNCGVIEQIYPKPYGIIEPYPYLGWPESRTSVCETFNPNYGFGYGPIGPCATEIINPCQDIITSRNYYGIPEIITPNCYNSPCGVEILTPNPFGPCNSEVITYNPGCFGGFNELIAPIPYNSYCGDIRTPCNSYGLEVISPCGQFYPGPEILTPVTPCNCGCFSNYPEITPCNNFGYTEIISPCNTGCFPDIATPCGPYYKGIPELPCNCGCFGNYPERTPCNNFGYTEIISPCNSGCFPEIVTSFGPYYNGIPEVIPPFYGPRCAGPEVLPFNPFRPCNSPEIVAPCFNNFPEVIIPSSCKPGCSGCDFCGPASFGPSFFGVNPSFGPVEVDVILPPAIPAQLNCNVGYMPSCGPVVNFNVEPLPYGPGFCF